MANVALTMATSIIRLESVHEHQEWPWPDTHSHRRYGHSSADVERRRRSDAPHRARMQHAAQWAVSKQHAE